MSSPTIYNRFEAITKSDTADLPAWLAEGRLTDAVYVGVTGIIVYVDANNVACTFKGAIAGTFQPIAARRINSTTTSATDLVACYAQ